MGTRPIGHPQASPQIMRIRHAIEDQEQRRTGSGLQLFEQAIEGPGLLDGLNTRHHPLMPMRATQPGQSQAIGVDQPNASLARPLQELTHPRIAPGGVNVDLKHRMRCRLQPNADCMKSEQGFSR
jgi:hypothetical protein